MYFKETTSESPCIYKEKNYILKILTKKRMTLIGGQNLKQFEAMMSLLEKATMEGAKASWISLLF